MLMSKRLTNWAIVLVAGFVALKIFLSIGANSLWLDEIASMSLAYIPAGAPTRWSHLLPSGVVRWFALLSTAIDPHFPTIYAITRVGSEAMYFDGLSLEYFVRAPIVLTMLAIFAIFIWLCLAGRTAAGGVLLVSATMLVFVLDPGWRQHSAEARMYGLMSVTGIAMLGAVFNDRLLLASWLGLVLVLFHPFGAMFGFVPAVVALLFFRGRLSRGATFGILAGLVITCILVCAWMLLKFVLKSSSGFTAGGNSADIFGVLAGLNLYIAGITSALVVASVLIFRSGSPEYCKTSLIFLGVLVSGAAFIGALIVLKPSTPPYMRYISWANSVLLVMSVMCALMLVQRALPKLLRVAALPLALAGCMGVVVVARGATFGPPWGNSLREAALYLNAVATDSSVVTHDSFEMFDIPRPFRVGYRCFRGGQSVAYLSPAVRARMPCQSGNDVAIPDDALKVFVIREPIAWVGPRRIQLDAFDKEATIPFGNASVDVYRRRAE